MFILPKARLSVRRSVHIPNDHAGRLLTVKHKLDALGEVTLVNNVYDDLGASTVEVDCMAVAVNKQTYAYNIRN